MPQTQETLLEPIQVQKIPSLQDVGNAIPPFRATYLHFTFLLQRDLPRGKDLFPFGLFALALKTCLDHTRSAQSCLESRGRGLDEVYEVEASELSRWVADFLHRVHDKETRWRTLDYLNQAAKIGVLEINAVGKDRPGDRWVVTIFRAHAWLETYFHSVVTKFGFTTPSQADKIARTLRCINAVPLDKIVPPRPAMNPRTWSRWGRKCVLGQLRAIWGGGVDGGGARERAGRATRLRQAQWSISVGAIRQARRGATTSEIEEHVVQRYIETVEGNDFHKAWITYPLGHERVAGLMGLSFCSVQEYTVELRNDRNSPVIIENRQIPLTTTPVTGGEEMTVAQKKYARHTKGAPPFRRIKVGRTTNEAGYGRNLYKLVVDAPVKVKFRNGFQNYEFGSVPESLHLDLKNPNSTSRPNSFYGVYWKNFELPIPTRRQLTYLPGYLSSPEYHLPGITTAWRVQRCQPRPSLHRRQDSWAAIVGKVDRDITNPRRKNQRKTVCLPDWRILRYPGTKETTTGNLDKRLGSTLTEGRYSSRSKSR